MNQMWSIVRKELKGYFGSPMAAIFIGTFLLAALFLFFWVETFFARNIADIRPLFRWFPLLLIFLVAALTMRQWSEEEKMGTLEILFTLPVNMFHLVMGKFLAVLLLVTVALVLTCGLPFTVSMIGTVDWGPIVAGYLGTLLMACAYIAIGLFISSRTDNQIVALILTVLVGICFYLVGSPGITDFFGNQTGEFLRSLGTGSHFSSIERGVIDIRNVAYYLSLTAFFLILNTVSLDRKRWSTGRNTAAYRRSIMLVTILAFANLLALNVWLHKVHSFRLDLTSDQLYSISDSTTDLIANLQEPLLLRGYFSEKTHPLLAPLIPRIKDLMTEYEIASGGRVAVEFVNPTDVDVETEANQQYGIKPVPFQVSGRYEASVVNSYFNILIKYGDQYVTLGFNDLIEIQRHKDGQLDVGLRNLEYDLTKSIKKVVYGFQSIGAVFAEIPGKIRLTGLITPESIPEPIREVGDRLAKVVADLEKESGGKVEFMAINPDSDPNMGRQRVKQLYGVDPIPVSFFSEETFYLYLFLENESGNERIFITGEMTEAEIRQEVESALKRSSSGFMKTIGIWAPPAPMMNSMYGPQPGREQYQMFQQVLRENYNVEPVDLSAGRVAGKVDVLLLAAPQAMTELERFAVDQYFMKGGSVVALAGSYVLDMQPNSGDLRLKQTVDGIGDLLTEYGVSVGDTLVMDRQNEPFPIPVARNIGGFTVQEIKLLDYPFFVDVRQDGMNAGNPALANLPAVTLNYVSPLTVDDDAVAGKQLTPLLHSTDQSWLHSSLEIQPDFDRYPERGFPDGDNFEKYMLAVALKGQFESYFADREDPRKQAAVEKQAEAEKNAEGEGKGPETGDDTGSPAMPVITRSPESSRLVVVGSSEFVSDIVMNISRGMGQDRFLNSLEFLQNIIDWSVEDEELLGIRSRGTHARMLNPLTRDQQRFWELFNYGIALAVLIGVSLYGAVKKRRETPITLDV